MNALMYAALPPSAASPPPSKEALSAILDHYGFDHFLHRTLRTINLNNKEYSDIIDDVVDGFSGDGELSAFSFGRTFNIILEDVMAEQDCTKEEALEILAEDDYLIDVNTAMTYSVEAGDADIDALSELVRNRATRLLRQINGGRND